MLNKRLRFYRLKTFLKTRLFANKQKNLSFLQPKSPFGIGNLYRDRFYFGRFKRIFRFFRLTKHKSMTGMASRIRVASLVRLFRTSKFSRKFWWKVAQKFKRFNSIRRPVRVFRSNSFWRFPFSRTKINLLRVMKSSKAFSKLKRKRVRYFFSPKTLPKRIRSFFFLNRSKWRVNKDLSILRVRFTLNNLFVTLSNSAGKNLITTSSGALGFKGTTKLTTYAIEKVGLFLVKFMRKRRYRNLYVIFNSGAVGYRSKLFIETLIYNSLIVRYLTVSDSIPHNGVRPRKTKRR